MNPIYLSYFLSESTPTYGGDEGVIHFEQIRSIKKGDTTNNLQLVFPNHIGTHIDFPYHFDDNGKKCEDYTPAFWIFNKIGVINCSIEMLPLEIEKLSSAIEILILKTGFGRTRETMEYWTSQPVIPSGYASLLRDHFPNLRIFGFDLISLTSKLNRIEGKKAHMNFLIKENILILEDMNLESLETIPKTIMISPLLIQGADGVPCTIIAY